MNNINILDCTLRDGGYINNWDFGYEAIIDIVNRSATLGCDIIEIGFMRDNLYNKDNATMTNMFDFKNICKERIGNEKYAVMIEMASEYPLHKIPRRDADTFDVVRYVFWKRYLEEGISYSKKLIEKGYDVAIQPTRVEQYNFEEFKEMVKRFSEVKPYALYIVDTFGVLNVDLLKKYAEIADRYLHKDIILGYHAHNNMQQAYGNACQFVEMGLERKLLVDISAFGMGRGAGNLNSELFLNYLNSNSDNKYDISIIFEIWDKWLKNIYDETPWGYSLYYFLTALYKSNPMYGYYLQQRNIPISDVEQIFRDMPIDKRIVYDVKYLETILEN